LALDQISAGIGQADAAAEHPSPVDRSVRPLASYAGRFVQLLAYRVRQEAIEHKASTKPLLFPPICLAPEVIECLQRALEGVLNALLSRRPGKLVRHLLPHVLATNFAHTPLSKQADVNAIRHRVIVV
jgi:hypothetical protein